jgi:hypothetical protein
MQPQTHTNGAQNPEELGQIQGRPNTGLTSLFSKGYEGSRADWNPRSGRSWDLTYRKRTWFVEFAKTRNAIASNFVKH